MIRPLLALALAAGLLHPPQGDLRAFQTPSGNIGCSADNMSGRWELRCDIGEKNWRSPARPADCDLDYGDSFGMSGGGRPYWGCHGDTVLHQGPVLAYGRTWRTGPSTCTSAVAGVTCRNAAGHGFSLSRASYRMF